MILKSPIRGAPLTQKRRGLLYMKANEFVKKFGWELARICLLNCLSPADKWFTHEGDLICDQDFDDLKRLVESHELVESYGGLGYSKKAYEFRPFEYWDDLKQAIADVESCQ